MARVIWWLYSVTFVLCVVVVALALNGADVSVGIHAQLAVYAFMLFGRARVTAFFVDIVEVLRSRRG